MRKFNPHYSGLGDGNTPFPRPVISGPHPLSRADGSPVPLGSSMGSPYSGVGVDRCECGELIRFDTDGNGHIVPLDAESYRLHECPSGSSPDQTGTGQGAAGE